MIRLRPAGYAGQVRLLVLLPAAMVLAGCDPQTLKGSIAGGECRVFERPAYAVRGLRPYDQNWIDSQVEGGVGACGWSRPLPRPAAIDAAKPVAVAAPPRRRGVVARIKAAVHRQPAAAAPAPAAPIAAPDPEPDAKAPEVRPSEVKMPEPPPRSRLDLLLDRAGPAVHGAAR